VMSRNGAVATTPAEASRTGASNLMSGGNAMDAAAGA
jgi:gamma-glutamyltranspeptidase